jgi:hypothetical protein
MLAVQGCDSGTAAQTTAAHAALGAQHDLTIAGARAAFESYLTISDSAAAAGDATAGLSVVADAAWETVHAQYTALASTGAPVPRYQYGTPVFYVPTAENYPHWFLATASQRAVDGGGTNTVLMVFGQTKQGATWLLDGSAALAPGQSMPAIALDADGYATALPTYEQSLLLPPNVVGATQASVVDEGPAAAAAAVIAAGPQTTGLYAQQFAESHVIAATGLDYTWLLQGSTFPVFALRTTDGGALVLYGMYVSTTRAYPDTLAGAAIPVPANVTPLLPTSEIGYHAVAANSTYEFAAVDPAATVTHAKVTIIAASGALSYAHAY